VLVSALLEAFSAVLYARGGEAWTTIAIVVGIAGALLAAVGACIAAGHWWPLMIVLLAQTLVLIVAGGVFATWRLHRHGVAVDAVVTA
jgi:hypothetical protein